jgi:hypothetical protein
MLCQESRHCLGYLREVVRGRLSWRGRWVLDVNEVRSQLFVCGVYCKSHAQP